jgi:uncharacterized metal-binding protein YceD (DUF177 family)
VSSLPPFDLAKLAGAAPEFSRLVDIRQVSDKPLVLEPDAGERSALAARFDIVRIEAMRGDVVCVRDGAAVNVTGRLTASIVQPCAISGEDLAVTIDEPLVLRFVPASGLDQSPDEEIELDADALDEIPYEGTTFDLGEALAQTLALAIDPFATGPDADRVRNQFGLDAPEPSGPFAALAALKRDTPQKGS